MFEHIKQNVHNRWCRLKLIWAAGGYEDLVDLVCHHFSSALEIVPRPKEMKGLQVLPRRWVVEPTSDGLGGSRHLARDYKHTISYCEAMTCPASIPRMLKLATN